MTLNNFDMALYTVLFLIPGFAMNLSYTLFIPQREKAFQLVFLRFLFFSCINFALWWPLIFKLTKNSYYIPHPYRWSFIVIGIVLLFPLLLGFICGILTSKDWIIKILNRLNVHPLHPVPTAWEYILSKEEAWVCVTLKDGTRIYGRYGEGSFASSHGEKDMYLIENYSFTDGEWVAIPDSRGVWVSGTEILHIEFYEYNRTEDNTREEIIEEVNN